MATPPTPPPPPRRRFFGRRDRYVTEQETAVTSPGPPPPRVGMGMALGLLFALVLLGALAAIYFFTHRHHHRQQTTTVVVTTTPQQASMPRVVGLTEQKALVRLGSLGLRPDEKFEPTKKPTGMVVSQNPQVGTSVNRGAKVTIVVDSGAPKVATPNVVGLAAAEATAKLSSAGLKATQTAVASTKPPGTVLDQAPSAGQQLTKGSTVMLSVAKQQNTAVPDVTHQQASAAESTLQSAGFKPAPVTVPGPPPKGIVLAQNPSPGSQAASGTKVRINVSDGVQGGTTTAAATTSTSPAQPATTQVPDLSGQNEQQAAQSLANAGLRASVTFVPSQDPQGTVEAQGKPAGTTVPRNSHVGINISEGPSPKPPKPVPNVVGQAESQAVSALNGAGFHVIVIKVAATTSAQAGKVTEETPSAGSSEPQGVQVIVYVGRARA